MIDRRAGAPDESVDSRSSYQGGIVPALAPIGHSFGVASRQAGYLMIESFEIKNFQCFESLKLSGLKRINVITGENASGKTALLEALLAGSRANGEALLFLNQFRQITTAASPLGFPISLNTLQFQSLWDHWFYSFKKKTSEKEPAQTITTTQITFRYADSDGKNYTCDFTYNLQPGLQATTGLSSVPFQVKRSVTEKGKQQPDQSAGIMFLNPQGQPQSNPPLAPLGPSIFIFTAALNYAEGDNVVWFSQLRQRTETAEIVSFFRKNFPFIANLEVLQPTIGAPAAIYATLTSGTVRPLQVISSGIHKIISILLGCAHSRKGIILIDEIENGIFFDKYSLTWDVLNKFSKDYGCQIFVTSHSLECLQKLAPVMENDVDDFSLLQTIRENGTCAVRHVSGTAMKAALMGGNEIRGGNGKWGSRNNASPSSALRRHARRSIFSLPRFAAKSSCVPGGVLRQYCWSTARARRH
jgi:hypothetical protein